MKRTILIRTAVLAVFMAAFDNSVALAQHTGHGGHSSSPEAVYVVHTGKTKGRVVEVDKNSVTVETQQKRGVTQDTFQIADATKIKGNLSAGADVVIKYRHASGAKIATSIEVKKAKQTRKP